MARIKAGIIARIIGSVLIAGGIAAVIALRVDKKATDEEQLVRPIKTITAGKQVQALRGQYAGRVIAAQRVEMGFEVPGTLSEKLVNSGDEVTKGQVLARLDARDFQNDLIAAEAGLERARAQRDRMRQAAAKNAISKQELDNAEASFEIAEAEMRIKQKALSDSVLKATFDGLIADTYVDNYQNVRAKQPILSLQDVSSLEIEVSIPEQRVASAKRGEKSRYNYRAIFDYFPDRPFDVTIKEFSTEADPVTQTFTARFLLEVAEDVMILPGMTTTVLEYTNEGTGEAGVIMLPLDVVPTTSDGGYFVWRIRQSDDGTATIEKVAVKVGRLVDDQVEILSGLNSGDMVAAAGVTLLAEGQVVRPMTEE